MEDCPPVSCMCLTYGRPHLLEEAVHSFLLQDYAGVKELVVLNDFDRQFLVCDHPEVHVVNVPRRFRTLGEKRNACAALAAHEFLFVWDDDDIFLPHRLSYSIRMLDPAKGFFKPSKAFVLNNGQVTGPHANLFHSGACFTRELFDRAHGYPHMGSGQDMELELAFERILGPGKNFNGIAPQDIFYVYRWGGTQSYHFSGFGRDAPRRATGLEQTRRYVDRQIGSGELATGEIRVQPRWHRDYVRLVRDYMTEKADRTTCGECRSGIDGCAPG